MFDAAWACANTTRSAQALCAVAACLLCSCRAGAARDAMTDDAQSVHPTPKPTAPLTGDAGNDAAVALGDAGLGEPLSSERAGWPMPNSKNLALPHPARLRRVEADGGVGAVVHDLVTDLFWSGASDERVHFETAAEHCSDLARASQSAWRLPTRLELVSLIDRSYTPTLDPLFGATEADYFWTASPVPEQTGVRFSVYFGVGETAWGPEQDSLAFTRCVRGGRQVRAPEYHVEADAVRAVHGELLWQRAASESALTLEAARLYCSTLLLGGTRARLPTPKELQTLLDPSQRNAGYWLPSAFAAPKAAEFWADETDTLAPMRVDFASGFSGVADVGDEFYARCVR